jgi:WD40 repeat protein
LFLASLGGEDDNSIVLWDLQTGQALCGNPASRESAGNALCLSFSNTSDNVFVSGGEYTLRVWEYESSIKKIRPTDCQLGSLKRVINCIAVDDKDENIYCGTSTGDVLEVKMATKLFRHAGPAKNLLSKGILSLALSTSSELIVGNGTGTVAVMKRANLAITR